MKSILRTIHAYVFMLSLLKKSQSKRLIIFPIYVIFKAILPFIPIVFPALIINNLVSSSDWKTILFLIVCMCLSGFILKFVIEVLDEYDIVWEACFAFQMTGIILKKYMELDIEDIETPEIYDKFSMADAALEKGIGYFLDSIKELSIKIIELIIASVLIATLHPIIIIVLIGCTFLSSWIQKKRMQFERDFDVESIGERRKYSYFYDTVNDFIYGKEIRIYGIKDKFMVRIGALTDKYISMLRKTKAKSNKWQGFYNSINYIQQAGIYIYMIVAFSFKMITIGGFTAYLGSIERFKNALNAISETIIKMNDMGFRILDLQSFLSIESKLCKTHKGDVYIRDCHNYDIRFVNVGFHYPNSDIMVLKNVNITIPYGEKLTIVGENGAGKTTFIKLLLRLYDPTEGDIYLGNRNIRDLPLEEYHGILAAVFQDYKMLSFTVKENIEFGKEPETEEDRIHEILHMVNMDTKIDSLPLGLDTYLYRDYNEDGVEMSGGEMQRLAIARAINRDACIFIMDEPASALDAIAEEEIYRLFEKIIAKNTGIFISHRMSSARLGDKIVLFSNGEIAEYGTFDDLIKIKGKFFEMYKMQAQYYVGTRKNR